MRRLSALALWVALACDPAPAVPDGGGDAAAPDAGPPSPASTAHCTYAPLPATARAGGTVAAGPIQVGVAERRLDLPVGTALGGNTSRAAPLDNQGYVDGREVPLSGSFTPSVGVETIPMAKAVAITAGDETVVLVRTDTIFGDDTITHEVTERLGPDFAGKLLWLSSHTHTAGEQYSADSKLQVGGGPIRAMVRRRLIDRIEETARAALDAREPARIGVAMIDDFDPEDRVSYDRRPENDFLTGGEAQKDTHLAVIRVDRTDGTPMAILPIFGVHSAILDDDVSLFSTDASGAYERALEEEFDLPITAIHLQGAAGDVLGSSDGHLAHADGEPRWDFARNEENGRWALPQILAVWEAAGEVMQGEIALEMVTRSIELGPDWETFTVRGGALRYAPFDGRRECDGRIFAEDGSVLSPIDEFNAPFGAALCGERAANPLPGSRMPGTVDLQAYGSCATIPRATQILGIILDFEFETPPLCASTRTTISALRLGDWMIATAPGEPVVPWAAHVRASSSFPPERTIVLGYAQGHVGYILRPEDWLQGGFEPSINSWGPLEGELIAERLIELMALAASDAREDAAAGGADRVAPPAFTDGRVPAADEAPMAGAVPDEVPAEVYLRGGAHPARGQPEPTLERVHGVARFVWIGEDPLSGTPRVTLEREEGGAFVPVTRRSGRAVEDLDLLLVWTPLPLRWEEGRTHYWTLEWQAVSWHGAPGLSALPDRAGLPLGRYRFRVEGTGYAIESDPFEVVPAALSTSARADGGAVVIEAGFEAREGWRLLRMEGLSNRYVPIETGPVTIELGYASGESETLTGVALEAPGVVRVTPASAGSVDRVVITDRFGNRGEASL